MQSLQNGLFVSRPARADRAAAAAPSHETLANACTAGSGVLHFARVGSRTVLQRAFAVSPLKILNPYAGRGAAWVYTATYGGGLVGGDMIDLRIDVGPRAYSVLTTQSSTKIYRSTRPAIQHTSARISDHGLLVVAPDATVCFSGASFQQQQRFYLSTEASVVVVDWMTCGRRAMGERWAFNRYSGRLELFRDGRRFLYDSILLSPEEGPIGERMGRFNVWATLVLVGPLVAATASAAIAEIADVPIERRGGFLISAARLDNDGALLRMAGHSVEEIGIVLRQHLRFLHECLGEEPWGRKW